MKFTSFVSVLGLASAAAVPDPGMTGHSAANKRAVDPQAAAAKCASNGWDCCPLPTSTLPVPDTANAFLNYATYSSYATRASAPANYSTAFTNKQGSTDEIGYRGVFTLDNYDPSLCAAKCNADKDCLGFNIFIQREPKLRPDYDVCKNPDPTANVKCTLYGYPVSGEMATNKGAYFSDFQSVIVASNGYNKQNYVAPHVTDFYTPLGPLAGAIQYDSYYLYELYTTGFDPTLCGKGCKANTAYNAAHPPATGFPKRCMAFNAYIQFKNGNPEGTFCSYYSSIVVDPTSKATNVGETRGSDRYTIGRSYYYEIPG